MHLVSDDDSVFFPLTSTTRLPRLYKILVSDIKTVLTTFAFLFALSVTSCPGILCPRNSVTETTSPLNSILPKWFKKRNAPSNTVNHSTQEETSFMFSFRRVREALEWYCASRDCGKWSFKYPRVFFLFVRAISWQMTYEMRKSHAGLTTVPHDRGFIERYPRPWLAI